MEAEMRSLHLQVDAEWRNQKDVVEEERIEVQEE